MAATSIAVNDCYPANNLPRRENTALQIGGLPAELLRIEQIAVAESSDSQQALEAAIRAIASLDTVCGVEVAVSHGGRFAFLASAGPAGLQGREKRGEIYTQCLDSGRMLRCDGGILEGSGLSCSSALLMPFFVRGGAIGVLATFSERVGVLTNDYIVPLATAAAICGALAQRIHKAQEDVGVSPATNTCDAESDTGHDREQTTHDEPTNLHFHLAHGNTSSNVQPSVSAPVEVRDLNDRFACNDSSASRANSERCVLVGKSLSSEDDALRSVLLKGRPMLPGSHSASVPATGPKLWNLIIVVLVVLALSCLVFGIVKLAG